MQSNSTPWCSVLLLLCIVKQSQQTPEDAIQRLNNLLQDKLSLIDSKLTNVDQELLRINTRFESEMIKINSRLNRMDTSLGEVKDDLVLILGTVQSVDSELPAIGARSSLSLQLTQSMKAMQEQHYNEGKVVNENISHDLQTLKDKVIDRNSFSFEEIKDTALSLKSLGDFTSEKIQLLKEEGSLCTNDEIFNKLTTIGTNVIGVDNDLSNYFEIINKFVNESTQLIFNHSQISVSNEQSVSLDCGVVGEYHSCYWEHNNLIYQLADVSSGSYSNMRRASNTARNQCGITITSVRPDHEGVWACKVLTFGHTLIATLSIKLIPYGFEEYNGRIVLLTKRSHRRMTFQKSVERCTSMNAKPFIPYTQKDFDLIIQVNKELAKGGDQDIWVPVSYIHTEGHLKWTDNTDASSSAGLKWCNGQTLYKNAHGFDCGWIYQIDCPDTVQMGGCSYTPFPMICEI